MKRKILIVLTSITLLIHFTAISTLAASSVDLISSSKTVYPGNSTFNLGKTMNVSSYTIDTSSGSLSSEFKVEFYNGEGQKLGQHTPSINGRSYSVNSSIFSEVTKVVLVSYAPGARNVYKFSVSGDISDTTPPGEVTNLTAKPGDGRITLNWGNPNDSDLARVNIYRDGVLVHYDISLPLINTSINTGLNNNQEYTFKVTTVDVNGNESTGKTIKATTIDTIPPGNIKDVSAIPGDKNVLISYALPTDSDFSHLKVIRDGEVIASNVTSTTFTDEGLDPETTYQYKFISVDTEGNESSGVVQSITTNEEFFPLKDVTELNAETDYNRVDLSWNLPNSTEFKHVNIYRGEVIEEPNFFEKLFFGMAVEAAEEPTKIFETNGTYFNDLTVEPTTTYEYKLSTESTTGEETEGVTVQTTTLEEPTPLLDGVESEKDAAGDYVYSWTSPTVGKVKILVGGEEYVTVDAADGTITIPKDDMKTTSLGDPDVTLIPIGEFGTVGEEFSNSKTMDKIKLPFTLTDILSTTTGLISILGGFILVVLAFLFYPRIKNLIFKAAAKYKERKERVE